MDSSVNLVEAPPLTQKIAPWIFPMEDLPYKKDFEKLTPEECAYMGFDCK